MSGDIRPAWRAPLLALGFAALAAGVGGGLMRLGWGIPAPADAAIHHGPLMVCGFFGTVIGLERAVALRRIWAYAAALCSGLGGVALVLGAPRHAAPALFVAASLLVLGASLQVYARQRALFTLTLALGAACWLAGNLLWLGGLAVYSAIPWWIGFLVLTIAGERLELSRVLPASPSAKRVFGAIIAVMLVAMTLSPVQPAIGTMLLAATLLALAAWLLRQDIARRTIRQGGLTRYIAACLLSGYAWLAAGALIGLASGGIVPGGAGYDAAIHALMLGFVFSMVFGHAPIIFPAVLRVQVSYHPLFYLPLAALHGSIAVRLAGDLLGAPPLRSMGGLLNALALLLFIAGMIGGVVRASTAAKRRKTV